MSYHLLICSFTLLAITSGCGSSGPAMYPVSGKVSFNSEPVTEGNIAFIPTDGSGAAQGGPIVNGAYQTKVTAGPKKIEIYGERKSGKKETQEDGKVVELKESFIPSKYNDNSELTVTIEAKSSTHDFELKGKK